MSQYVTLLSCSLRLVVEEGNPAITYGVLSFSVHCQSFQKIEGGIAALEGEHDAVYVAFLQTADVLVVSEQTKENSSR